MVRLRKQMGVHEVAFAIMRLKGKMTLRTQPLLRERLAELLHGQMARSGAHHVMPSKARFTLERPSRCRTKGCEGKGTIVENQVGRQLDDNP